MKEGEKQGLMDCFCLNLLKVNPARVYPRSKLNIVFSEFKTYEVDETPYCFDWFTNYTQQQLIITLSSCILVAFNVIICFIFELISKCEKHHTANEETMGNF